MSGTKPLSLSVSFKGKTHPLSVLPDATVSSLQAQLEQLTSIPPPLQKLLFKGKVLKGAQNDDVTLVQAGFKDGLKVQLLGTTYQAVDGLKAASDEFHKRERILEKRAQMAPTKLRSTGGGTSENLNYRFHQILPLPHLPNPQSALEVLKKLADDQAIQHIMRKHQFSVGILTELAPHEHPNLLGLNVNQGQEIKLRLRSQFELEGFRPYYEIRRCLCHELTHNVWGDHDNNFKQLNSQLNREVAAYERDKADGTHYLSRPGEVYEPSSELEAEAAIHILGGPGAISQAENETKEERRQRLLAATMSRLRREEEQLEESCGTTTSSKP